MYFFCFTVLFLIYFLLYFTVLLKLLRRLYIGGSIFKYRQCLIIAPGVRTRIYAFVAPASRLRVRCTNYLLTRRCITN